MFIELKDVRYTQANQVELTRVCINILSISAFGNISDFARNSNNLTTDYLTFVTNIERTYYTKLNFEELKRLIGLSLPKKDKTLITRFDNLLGENKE